MTTEPTTPRSRLAAALAVAFHETRWCKWSDPGHAVAHDDADEDGYRSNLADTILAADPHLAAALALGEAWAAVERVLPGDFPVSVARDRDDGSYVATAWAHHGRGPTPDLALLALAAALTAEVGS